MEQGGPIQLTCKAAVGRRTSTMQMPSDVEWFKDDDQRIVSDIDRGLLITTTTTTMKPTSSSSSTTSSSFRSLSYSAAAASGGGDGDEQQRQTMVISVLIILSSRSTDSGLYLCRSSDGHKAHITVHVISGRPIRNTSMKQQLQGALIYSNHTSA